MNGKGSDPRPLSVSRGDFARRWDETFHPPRPALVPNIQEFEDELYIENVRNIHKNAPITRRKS